MQALEKITWTVSDILTATSGDLICGGLEQTVTGISTNSRTISPTELFIGLNGDTYDGFDFINTVVDQGISVLIVNKENVSRLPREKFEQKRIACISVPDTLYALGALALFHRKRINVSTVAITGSNGKTTTREMTTAVLAKQFCTLATTGNFNNEIGLPLTLLKLLPQHEWAVVELGMNHFGEIRRLSAICEPDIGIITNIGSAHLEGVGSVSGVMKAKGELLENITKSGTAILNADDERVMRLRKHTHTQTLLFGTSKKALIRAEAIREKNYKTFFELKTPVGDLPITLNTPGRFMVLNALAAVAAGYLVGIEIQKVKSALEAFVPIPGRMKIFSTFNGIHIIDDSYNANPDSMKAAISTLFRLSQGKKCLIVLGDMLELGDKAAGLHYEIGAFAANSATSRLYAFGSFAESVAEGAKERGMDENHIMTGTKVSICNDLIQRLQPGNWVLVKGSRGMTMEEIVKKLTIWGNGKGV